MKYGTTASNNSVRRRAAAKSPLAAAAEEQRKARQGSLLEGAGEALTRDAQGQQRLEGMKRRFQLELAGINEGQDYEDALQMEKFGQIPEQGKIRGILEGLQVGGNVLKLAAAQNPLGFLRAPGFIASKITGQSSKDVLAPEPEDDFWRALKAVIKSDDLTAAEAYPSLFSDDGDVSMEAVFNQYGWEKTDNRVNNIVRGVAKFGVDMALDPTNYVSFGSWGVSRALASRVGVNIFKQSALLAREIAEQGGRHADSLVNEMAKVMGPKAEEGIRKGLAEALEAAKASPLESMIDDVTGDVILSPETVEAVQWAAWEAAEKETFREVAAPVMSRIVERDWAALPEWFSKSAAVKTQAPFLRGGVQLTPNPFGGGLRTPSLTKPIPGTIGLGKKIKTFLVGAGADPNRTDNYLSLYGRINKEGGGLLKATTRQRSMVSDMVRKLDNDKNLVDILRAGTPEAIGKYEFLAGGRNAAKSALGVRGLQEAHTRLGKNLLQRSLKLDPATSRQVDDVLNSAITNGVFSGGDIEAMRVFKDTIGNLVGEDAVADYVQWGNFVRQSMDDVYKQAKDLGMEINYVEDHFPLVFTPEMAKVVRTFNDQAIAVDFDNVPEVLRDGYEMLAEILGKSQHKSGMAGTVVGDSRFADPRGLGQTVVLGDVVSLFRSDAMTARFKSHAEMNEAIYAAARDLAEKNNIKVGKWDSAVEMNPVMTMNKYLISMSQALEERWLIREGQKVGAWKPKTFRQDAGRLLSQMSIVTSDPKTIAQLNHRLDRIIEVMSDNAGIIAKDQEHMVSINFGPLLGEREVPVIAIKNMSPKLAKKIEQVAQRQRVMIANQQSLATARKELAKKLVAQGVPEDQAVALAAIESIREFKTAVRQVVADTQAKARTEAEDLYSIANRMQLESEVDAKKARALAREAFNVRRNAKKAELRALDAVHREFSKEVKAVFRSQPALVSFEDEASRKMLAKSLADDVADTLDSIAPDDMGPIVEKLRQLARQLAEDGDMDAATVGFGAIRKDLVAALNTPAPEGYLDQVRGLAEDGLEIIAKTELLSLTPFNLSKTLRAPSEGDANIFDMLYSYYHQLVDVASSPKLPAKHKERAERALRSVRGIVNAIKNDLEKPDELVKYREWMNGEQLLEQLTIIEKIVKGQNLTRNANLRTRLIEMMESNGMLGDTMRLRVTKNTLGFDIAEDITELADHPNILADVENGFAEAWQVLDPEFKAAQTAGRAAVRKLRKVEEMRSDMKAITRLMDANKWGDVTHEFKMFRNKYGKIMAPADRAQLDLAWDSISREAVLRSAPNDPILRRNIDAANAARRTLMDPEATATSLDQLTTAIAERQATKNISEEGKALMMLGEMEQILRSVVGLAKSPDGGSTKVFFTEAEEQVVNKLLDRGQRIWQRLDLGDDVDPFKPRGATASAEEQGYVDPANFGLFGDEWDSAVGDKFALEWMRNATAQMMAVASEEGLTAFVSMIRKSNSWFKTMVTVPHPGFHINNIIGGHLNAFMADVGTKHFFASARTVGKFMRSLEDTGNLDLALEALPVEARTFYAWAHRSGLFDSTFASAEHLDRTLAAIERPLARKNPFSMYGPLARSGGVAMAHEEAYMRMAVFIRHFNPDAEDLEASARSAIGWVNATQFDYANLTQLELRIKSVMPFFVWFRRNLPMQMQALMYRPRFMQQYKHFMVNMDNPNDHQEGLPGGVYRERRLSAILGIENEDSPFWSSIILNPNVPVASLFELDDPLSLQAWGSLLANQLGPAFDIGATWAGFTDQSYWMTAPGGISQTMNFVESLPVLGLPGVESTPEGVARIRPWMSQLAQIAFPLARSYGGPALEQDPRRRGNLGQLPVPEVEGGDTATSDLLAVVRGGVGRAAGIGYESVDESYSNIVQSGMAFDDRMSELEKRGIITDDMKRLAQQMAANEAALAALRDS